MASERKLLAIPGPVELSPKVLEALGQPPLSHVSGEFVKIFQESLKMTRQVVGTTEGQPFIIAGSGTLGWEQVAANLIERGDKVLVVSTGYFGEGFRDCLKTHGAEVDVLAASTVGGTVRAEAVEAAVEKKEYKMVTITHVDTSTGVLCDARGICAAVRRASGKTLVVLDAVCSVASEELEMDGWGVDLVLTASQKGLGGPPGLSIVVAGPRALAHQRTESGSYYCSWKRWLPIMHAYEQGRAAYFGTPPVTLICAYHASLREIVPTLAERIRSHAAASARIKRAAEALGMVQVATDDGARAHGMTALYVPDAPKMLDEMARRGVVAAGGLIGSIKSRYIRIGHMGWTVVGGGGPEKMIGVLREAVGGAKL